MFGVVCINSVHGIGRVAQAHGGRRCEKLGIASKLKADDKDLVGKPLMKRIMQAWLPAHEVRRRMQSGPGVAGCMIFKVWFLSNVSAGVPVAQVLHSILLCGSAKHIKLCVLCLYEYLMAYFITHGSTTSKLHGCPLATCCCWSPSTVWVGVLILLSIL